MRLENCLSKVIITDHQGFPQEENTADTFHINHKNNEDVPDSKFNIKTQLDTAHKSSVRCV